MTRKRPPSVDFFYDDFLAGVSDMHPLAVGMYIRNLCFQWGHDFVPDNQRKMLQIMGVTQSEFDEHWPEVQAKMTRVTMDDGQVGWLNERAQTVMRHKLDVIEKRTEAGKKGGRPRKKQKVSPDESKTKAKKKQTWKKEVGSRKTEEGSPEDGSGKLSDATSENGYTSEFEAFWQAYPPGRRTSKGAAFAAWKKAIGFASPELLIARAAQYAKSPVGIGQYVKMPSTWLNQRCWEDDDQAWLGAGAGFTETELRSHVAGDLWIQDHNKNGGES